MRFIFIVLHTFSVQNIYADILFYYETAILSSINATKTKAIDNIATYAHDGQIAPTIQDYIDAGVIGVTIDNLSQVNEAIEALSYGDIDTRDEIQSLVDSLTKILTSVSISGTITYDLVPVNPNHVGLDYANLSAEKAKFIIIEVLDSSGQILGTTSTDSNGHYTLSDIPLSTNVRIRALAKLFKTSLPSWDIKVVDNTNSDALYVMQGTLTDSGTANSIRDLHAPSGWDSTAYTSERVAAPFAILDTVYKSIVTVVSADALANFPPLIINWSVNNVATSGDTTLGQITTSHYTNRKLFILGDENSDTDEYDDHVIAHEWTHYYEDIFSRSDSIGGSHGGGDRLDIRVAFSEGFANAMSAITLHDTFYFDTYGTSQTNGFFFDMETDTPDNPGWYSEASIQRIIYDLYDTNCDTADTVSLDFLPLHQVFTGTQKNTAAFTSIFSFIDALKLQETSLTSEIDTILQNENITTITDIYGSGRTNLPSEAPLYTTISIGETVNVCPTYTYGTYNKLGNRKYVLFTIDTYGDYTISVTKSNQEATTDPDFYLYDTSDQTLVTIAESGVANIETVTLPLNNTSYRMDIYDWNGISNACFDITVN